MVQNSASRVFDILTRAKKQNRALPTIKVWATVFGVSETLDGVAPLLVELYGQLDDVERQIRDKFDGRKAEISLKHFPALRQVVCFCGIGTQWSDAHDILTETVLFSLEALIHDVDEETELEPDEFTAINNALTQLFELVCHADISKKLKDWILNWLSAIRTSIDRYRISGTKGLQEALIRIQGEAQFFHPAFREVKKKAPAVYEQLFELFDKICKATEIAERCRKLCDSAVVGQIGNIVFKCLGNESPSDD